MSPEIARRGDVRRSSGFSLIEVVLVILVLGMLFLPVLRFFFGMTKSVTDSWSSVKASAIGLSALSEIQATPVASIMSWNGRVDPVGEWTRTITVEYVTRVGSRLEVSLLPTPLFRIKVTLNKAGSHEITLTTIVS